MIEWRSIDIEPLPLESDNHADTHCAGKNCRVEYYTNQSCAVSPFLSEYDALDDVPICSALTATTLDTGETIILRLGQSFDFHTRMDKTLINPNQVRSFGILLCDDPTDPYRNLGMQLDENTFLPMTMDGTTCGLMTRYPTDEELESYRIFTISDQQTWNPSQVTFQVSAMTGEGMTPRYKHGNVTFQSSQNFSNCLHPEHYDAYESCLSTVSTCLVPTLFDRQICEVSALIDSRRHHSPTAEALAAKWGCDIDIAKQTLECTTQENIRSAIQPLTRRYRTDLLSQRL